MNTTGWLKGLRVTAGGTGIVSHAGVALLAQRAQTCPAGAPPALVASATQLTSPASGYASLALRIHAAV